jgi:hypothetical protein
MRCVRLLQQAHGTACKHRLHAAAEGMHACAHQKVGSKVIVEQEEDGARKLQEYSCPEQQNVVFLHPACSIIGWRALCPFNVEGHQGGLLTLSIANLLGRNVN